MKYFKYAEIQYQTEIYLIFLVPKSVIKRVKAKITILCFDFTRYARKEQRNGNVVAVWLDENDELQNIDYHNKSYPFISQEYSYDQLKTLAKNTIWIDSSLLK
jgi:hypothetical protein